MLDFKKISFLKQDFSVAISAFQLIFHAIIMFRKQREMTRVAFTEKYIFLIMKLIITYFNYRMH